MSHGRALVAIALLSLAAVGAAVFTQHTWGMQPCPWCVLQRVVFVAIAAVALVAAALPRGVQVAGLGLVALLADAGLAAAVWQHFVAAEQASCSMTLADRIVGTLGLDERWPQVFMATASCAEAKVKLMGLPYEAWSGMLFGAIGLYAPWRVAFSFAKARRR